MTPRFCSTRSRSRLRGGRTALVATARSVPLRGLQRVFHEQDLCLRLSITPEDNRYRNFRRDYSEFGNHRVDRRLLAWRDLKPFRPHGEIAQLRFHITDE